MNTLDKYLSIAIKVQAAREGMTLKDIRTKAGIGQTTFTERINWWKKGTSFLKAKFFKKKYTQSF